MCIHVCAATTVCTSLGSNEHEAVRSLVLYQHLHLAHQVSGQGQNLLDVVMLSHFWKRKQNKAKKYNYSLLGRTKCVDRKK